MVFVELYLLICTTSASTVVIGGHSRTFSFILEQKTKDIFFHDKIRNRMNLTAKKSAKLIKIRSSEKNIVIFG